MKCVGLFLSILENEIENKTLCSPLLRSRSVRVLRLLSLSSSCILISSLAHSISISSITSSSISISSVAHSIFHLDLRRFQRRFFRVSAAVGFGYHRWFPFVSISSGFSGGWVFRFQRRFRFGFSGGSVRVVRRFGSGSAAVRFEFCGGLVLVLRRFAPVLRRSSILGYIKKVCETLSLYLIESLYF